MTDTKPPRRMRQPTKDALREQLALASAEIIRLRTPWWRRIFNRKRNPNGTF